MNEAVDKKDFDKFILLGFAGALRADLKVGKILEPNVVLGENFGLPENKIILDVKDTEDISLITTRKSLEFEDKKNYKNIDLVDMETFFVVREILNFQAASDQIFETKNIKIFKVVSDELDFRFPDELDAELFNVMFTGKNLTRKIKFLLKKNLKEKIKIFRMCFNFFKARKKLADFFADYINNEVKKHV